MNISFRKFKNRNPFFPLILSATIFTGCAGASGSGSGGGVSSSIGESAALPVALVAGNLPGPPTNTALANSSSSDGNIVNGPPPIDTVVAHPDSVSQFEGGYDAAPQDTDSYVSTQRSDDVHPAKKRIFVEVNISAISIHDSDWKKSWLTGTEQHTLSSAAPSWIIRPATDDAYTDSFQVDYTNPEWQRIVKSRLAKLAKSRIDGVCLVGCDSTSVSSKMDNAALNPMAELIIELAQSGHESNKNLIITPIDAQDLELSLSSDERSALFNAINIETLLKS